MFDKYSCRRRTYGTVHSKWECSVVIKCSAKFSGGQMFKTVQVKVHCVYCKLNREDTYSRALVGGKWKRVPGEIIVSRLMLALGTTSPPPPCSEEQCIVRQSRSIYTRPDQSAARYTAKGLKPLRLSVKLWFNLQRGDIRGMDVHQNKPRNYAPDSPWAVAS